MRSLGGHGSPGVQNGCVPGTGRPPGSVIVWLGVNGVAGMFGVRCAGMGQNAAAGVPGWGWEWVGHPINPGAEGAA